MSRNPSLAEIANNAAQQTVAIGVEAKSSAFNAATNLIRVHTDAICSITIGTSPTAGARAASSRAICINVRSRAYSFSATVVSFEDRYLVCVVCFVFWLN